MYTKAKLISKIKTATETRSFESAFFLMIVLDDSCYKYDLNYEEFIEIKKQLCKIAATSTTGEGSFWLE